VKEFTEVI